MILTLKTCTKKTNCTDCNNTACLHQGDIYADCPKWKCDNTPQFDCSHCNFIKEHLAYMRTEYQNQNKEENKHEKH